MKRILAVACCFTACAICATAQKKSAEPSMSDQQFVSFAGQTDMVDANLGQLAKAATPSKDIEDYGLKLVIDQTKDFRDLAQAAQSSSLTIPNAIDKTNDKTIIGPFQKLKGTAFDHRFVKEMIQEDTKAVSIYKSEASHAQTTVLRSYAADALPKLQADLAEAKKLDVAKAVAKKG